METETQYIALDAVIASLGLEYSAEFVPMSKARSLANDEGSPGLNWNVTLKKGRSVLNTNYFRGFFTIFEFNADGTFIQMGAGE